MKEKQRAKINERDLENKIKCGVCVFTLNRSCLLLVDIQHTQQCPCCLFRPSYLVLFFFTTGVCISIRCPSDFSLLVSLPPINN